MDFLTDITAKDLTLLISGALIALPVSGGWRGFKNWFQRRGLAATEFEEVWKNRLTAEDAEIRRMAFQEIVIRALYQFVLGNMLFAVSGIASIGDFLGIWPLQSLIAVVSSFVATLFFLSSAKWLRIYVRLSKLSM